MSIRSFFAAIPSTEVWQAALALAFVLLVAVAVAATWLPRQGRRSPRHGGTPPMPRVARTLTLMRRINGTRRSNRSAGARSKPHVSR